MAGNVVPQRLFFMPWLCVLCILKYSGQRSFVNMNSFLQAYLPNLCKTYNAKTTNHVKNHAVHVHFYLYKSHSDMISTINKASREKIT